MSRQSPFVAARNARALSPPLVPLGVRQLRTGGRLYLAAPGTEEAAAWSKWLTDHGYRSLPIIAAWATRDGVSGFVVPLASPPASALDDVIAEGWAIRGMAAWNSRPAVTIRQEPRERDE
jgi:hypothetical protein